MANFTQSINLKNLEYQLNLFIIIYVCICKWKERKSKSFGSKFISWNSNFL